MPTWTCTICHNTNNALAHLCETCWLKKREIFHPSVASEDREVLIGVGGGAQRIMAGWSFERPKGPRRRRGRRGLCRGGGMRKEGGGEGGIAETEGESDGDSVGETEGCSIGGPEWGSVEESESEGGVGG